MVDQRGLESVRIDVFMNNSNRLMMYDCLVMDNRSDMVDRKRDMRGYVCDCVMSGYSFGSFMGSFCLVMLLLSLLVGDLVMRRGSTCSSVIIVHLED